jgi:hypothetical protein
VRTVHSTLYCTIGTHVRTLTSGTAAEQGLSRLRCLPLSRIYGHGWSKVNEKEVEKVAGEKVAEGEEKEDD